ncbi:chondroitin sulfate synthase 1-like [Anneissia japonica]|uniref:chondroitin sulfate synthase 1-like n=1 Tax=Anneissia japonica TaxID=1529436 RepID=UPI0014257CC6|nr:chondroitin sulfate synthase 1-like [Anneissia japonica]
MQSLFYNNYSQSDLAYTGNLRTADVHKAITLHPVKRTPYMYRLHTYLMSVKGMDYQLKKIHLHREILSMKHILNENIDSVGRKFDELTNKLGLKPGLVKYTPEKHEDVLAWQFLSKFTFSEKTDLPRKSNSKSLISAMEDIILQIMLLTNANSMKVGRVIDFKEILYGYSRVVPHYGVDYILDLLLIYNKHKGKTRKLPVRRHIYVQQAFGEIEFIDNDEISKKFGKGPESLDLNSRNILSPVKSLYYLNQRRQVKEAIHFIMPLSGRYETFQRFMSNFEQTCLLPRENVKLLVVLFKAPENDPSSEIEQLIASYQVRYPWTELRVLHAIGVFSRGLALQLGASQYLSNALMFFVDVDMYLSEGFLGRCRENTQLGKQVYFPEVFSQYNPNVVYGQNMRPNSPLVIGKDVGFFRHYGFGLVCLYNEDLNRVGGMDASIVGWGLEDVDLFQKFVSSNITIFRAPDPGLVHIYHSVVCDENIDQRQYHMCLGSKAGTYASNAQLVKILGKYKEEANGKQ